MDCAGDGFGEEMHERRRITVRQYLEQKGMRRRKAIASMHMLETAASVNLVFPLAATPRNPSQNSSRRAEKRTAAHLWQPAEDDGVPRRRGVLCAPLWQRSRSVLRASALQLVVHDERQLRDKPMRLVAPLSGPTSARSRTAYR